VAERQHARVADKDVEPDDDRDVDERRLEVDLVGGRGEAAEQRDEADEDESEEREEEAA
jgi:hypothetical protein